VEQLTRHEHNLQRGLTPLTQDGEPTSDLRAIKVAVSPLSYGPIGDKVLSNTLLRSLAGARLHSLSSERKDIDAVNRFNRRFATILSQVSIIAPKREGMVDLFSYFMNVFWLDIGQFLYVANRARSTWEALMPLRHLTFSTRDFWTEVAFADRQGLTRDRWRAPDQ
jgi:hypothetical protein